jgi:SAM-dependent methyltransferase
VKERTDYIASNKEAWDRAALKYQPEIEPDVAFLRAGGVSLLEPERRLLGDLTGVRCAVHLQCSHGLDTLSLLNLGVDEVIGVDISPAMLDQAQRKAQALDAPAQWVQSDVLSVPEILDGVADLVYTGRGALPWVPDLDRWASVIVRLLKPGGRLFVHEGHPLNRVWKEGATSHQLSEDGRRYFDEHARPNEGFPALAAARFTPVDEAVPTAWEWQWTLGEVVTAVVDAGLRLERLEEHPSHFWDQFSGIPQEEMARLPHTYSLLARASAT